MTNQKKNIVIAGGGFAGLRAALVLGKKLRSPEFEIILIDEHDIHLYTPDLYEIATAFNKKISAECLTQLKDTVAIPFKKILEHLPVNFLRDKILKIHPQEKTLELEHHLRLSFEYLILCLGSVVNYYDIPGLRQFSYPLKTLTDALAIECHLDLYFQTLWRTEVKKHVDIVIGGGGATGVELSCELPGYVSKLCEKYHYPPDHVAIMIIEGSSQLTGQGEKITSIILERLKKLSVHARLSTYIREVEVNKIHVESNGKREILEMDILLWTGGVRAHPLLQECFSRTAKNGALPVNEYLQSFEFPCIFAAGDNAYCAAPMLAQVAFREGKVLAENLIAEIHGRKKIHYQFYNKGFIVPLGGKYAVFKKGNLILKGRLMWILRRLIDLMYALNILPFRYALRKWVHDTNIFVGND